MRAKHTQTVNFFLRDVLRKIATTTPRRQKHTHKTEKQIQFGTGARKKKLVLTDFFRKSEHILPRGRGHRFYLGMGMFPCTSTVLTGKQRGERYTSPTTTTSVRFYCCATGAYDCLAASVEGVNKSVYRIVWDHIELFDNTLLQLFLTPRAPPLNPRRKYGPQLLDWVHVTR